MLATLALGSGVYTYLGVRSLLDGSTTLVFFAAVAYAVSVSVAMYGFWTYLIHFLRRCATAAPPSSVRHHGGWLGDDGSAMSSWLNAAALAGSAAVEQHLAVTLEDYTTDSTRRTAMPSARCRCSRPSDASARLAGDEQNSGALTGVRGSGSVVPTPHSGCWLR